MTISTPTLASDSTHNPFINRETSVLTFNRRVLNMALNTNYPLLERLRYLCISSSNLDEFFEIRYASLVELTKDPDARTKPDGMRPKDAIELVNASAHQLADAQYQALETPNSNANIDVIEHRTCPRTNLSSQSMQQMQ